MRGFASRISIIEVEMGNGEKSQNRIGSLLEMPRPWVILAPMAGITDWACREISYQLGADVVFLPLVSATGLAIKPRRLLAAIEPLHENRPYVVQLYGKRPEEFRRAAQVLSEHVPAIGIDINMGCPVAQIVSSNHGSALMKDPELAAEIVAATVAGSSLPVSVKIRAGWDSVIAPDFARLMESAGAQLITIHGRTREQLFTGASDLDVVAAVRQAVSVPVIGNGDIVSVEAARQMLDTTGVDGLMIGRGAVGNPWLFAELQAALKGNHEYKARPESRFDVMRRHIQLSFEVEGEHAAKTIRKHLLGYSHGSRYAAQFRNKVKDLDTIEDVYAWVDKLEAVTDQ